MALTTEFLSAKTLSTTAAESSVVAYPPPNWRRQEVGMIHLGLGAFHRAHQAVYTQDAFAALGDERWGICGVTQRSDEVKRQLAPQDGLYGVLEGQGSSAKMTLVGSVREVLFPGHEQMALDRRFASTAVQVVTLTVTEKGYCRTVAGSLDRNNPAVARDLTGSPPTTAVGRLVRGLRHRADAGAGSLTVLSCDNLSSNGPAVRALVAEFCHESGQPDLSRWIDENVTFPSSMVDRIVPATTERNRVEAASILGLHDRGLVVSEAFRQWVIEDNFAAARPSWELAGAQIVEDVSPFERMKLWILNGTHSSIAYLGALRGYRTISEAMADPGIRRFATEFIASDVIPVTPRPESQDLVKYGEAVLDRFADPSLAHTTVQVAMDGSQKIPLRLLGPLRASLDAGRLPLFVLHGVAAWMAYLASPDADAAADELPVTDPLAERLTAGVRGRRSAREVVDVLLEMPEIFGSDLPERSDVREVLVAFVHEEMTAYRATRSL